jgi:hypothetical protein
VVRSRSTDRRRVERGRRGERHRNEATGRVGSAHRTRPRD